MYTYSRKNYQCALLLFPSFITPNFFIITYPPHVSICTLFPYPYVHCFTYPNSVDPPGP